MACRTVLCCLSFPFTILLFLVAPITLRDCRSRNEGPLDPQEQNSQAVTREERNNETRSDDATATATDDSENSSHRNIEKTILNILIGPFRSHRAFMCFPSATYTMGRFSHFSSVGLDHCVHVLSTVHGLKMLLALTVCVAHSHVPHVCQSFSQQT